MMYGWKYCVIGLSALLATAALASATAALASAVRRAWRSARIIACAATRSVGSDSAASFMRRWNHIRPDLQAKTSADRGRTPGFLRMAPVDPGEQIAELGGGDSHRAIGGARPQEAAPLQPLVPQLRMQTLRVCRCSLYGSRIRFTHCSNDASLASASATIGTASASCCKVTTAPYGRFPHNGPILRAWIPRLSWVMGGRFYAPSI